MNSNEMIVAYFKVLLWYPSGGAKGNNKECISQDS